MEQRPHRTGGKLIARDISESLAKLPPQDLPLEEAILGAVILESKAIERVKILRPDHFYTEAHKEIFRAIIHLLSHNEAIDMRTVVAQLRKDGKIEIVGGAAYIAELTNRVSSTANIETHARIIMEMAVKRSLIMDASATHQEAYEDTTDVFELLDRKILDLQALRDTTVKQTPESIVKKQWESRFLTSPPPKTVPLIVIGDCPVVTAGNYTLLIGKKKTRKTLFMVWLISEYLRKHSDHASRIILFDTEQGVEEVWEIREKIHKLSGKWVAVAHMRGQSPSERRDFIQYTVQFWPERPVLCSIDGVRDLVSNINDPDECTDVMVWLDRLTMEHNLAIINVIHMNKADNNARGHLGSELANKSLCTIEMELDQKTELTVVKCESSRKKPFESFAFTHSGDGLPTLADMPIGGKGTVMPQSDLSRRLEAAFVDGPMKYRDAWKAIGIQFECAETNARRMVAKFVRDGMIMKSGKDRDPNTMYKLITSEVSAAVPPNFKPLHQISSPDIPQPDLFSNGQNRHEPEPSVDDLPF